MEPNGPVGVHLVPFVCCQSYRLVWVNLDPPKGRNPQSPWNPHWLSRPYFLDYKAHIINVDGAVPKGMPMSKNDPHTV